MGRGSGACGNHAGRVHGANRIRDNRRAHRKSGVFGGRGVHGDA